MKNVSFFSGTKARYDALPEHDPDALYWLSDVREIRKGDELFSKGQEATSISSGLMSATDKEKLSHVRINRSSPTRIADYMYEISYDDYDYEYGNTYMERFSTVAMCSAMRNGNLVGRNYDWLYDEHPNFVVHTQAVNGRHATLGIATGIGTLTRDVVLSGADAEEYKALPFFMADVINDCGVYVNINVVTPGDRGYTTGTGGGSQRICQIMIPRYLADYAGSAKAAIVMLKHMDIYAPLNGLKEEAHFLICDKTDSYIVEFVNNEIVIYSNTDSEYLPLPTDECILTNFYLDGWNGELKTVYGGFSFDEVAETGLNLHAMGIERYQILRNLYPSIRSVADIDSAMRSVRYLKSYEQATNPFWYSEFTGDHSKSQLGDLTIYSEADDFAEILEIVEEFYRRFERDGSLWISSHTAVYDIESLRVYVYSEEDYDHRYEFQLNQPGKIAGADWSDF